MGLLSRAATLGKHDSGNERLRLGVVQSALISFDNPRTSESFPTTCRTELSSDSGISFSDGVGAQDSSDSVFEVGCNNDVFGSEPAVHVSGEVSDSTCTESSLEGVSGDINWETES